MTPRWIDAVLSSRITEVAARILLTFPFWGSGLAKLLDFSGGMAEMSHFGLEPAWFFNTLTVIVQLGGSALIIANRWTWLGAGALGVFTFLTIPIVHNFWSLDGERAVVAFHTATEHVGMIGALVLVSVLALRPRRTATHERELDYAIGTGA
ncbi:DoxX family protein [Microvirga roseola]|uniref:DoxX family protein n=1 Tax=Microvirga roseola TaxID=2883126 RepID=UPI001E4FABD6|nr:DoxX family protein [Microvirga roseola]